MLVLYVQAIVTLTMALHYFLIGIESAILFVLQEIFLMFLITMIFYFFTAEIGKILDKQTMSKMISVPLVFFNCVYTIVMTVASIVLSLENTYIFACNDWIWLYSSISGLLISLALFILSLYMNKQILKMNEYSYSKVSQPRLKHLL